MHVMSLAFRPLAIVALLLLAACEGSAVDPWPAVGEGLKSYCRGQSNCSVHDSDPTGR
jgi:hypothetical protein